MWIGRRLHELLVRPERLVEDAVAEALERAAGVPDLDERRARPRARRRRSGRSSRRRRRSGRSRGGSPRRTSWPRVRIRWRRVRGAPARRGRRPGSVRVAARASSSRMKARLPAMLGRAAVASTTAGSSGKRRPTPRRAGRQRAGRAEEVRTGDGEGASSRRSLTAAYREGDPAAALAAALARAGDVTGDPRPMRVHAILLAGGAGDRFGGELPKQFVRLAGEPILVRSSAAVAAAGVDRLVVVAHPELAAPRPEALADAAASPCPSAIVAGGVTRNESTRNGLAGPRRGTTTTSSLIHDAVRPLLPLEVIRRSIEPVGVRPRGRDGHGHPERRHARRSSRATARRRDPRPGAVPPRPDAPGVPQVGVLGARLRGGRGGGRPQRHRRLQPRPSLRARGAHRRPSPGTR